METEYSVTYWIIAHIIAIIIGGGMGIFIYWLHHHSINLGIIRNGNRIIGHRSLLKVLVNPFLRVVGLQIATNLRNGKLGTPCLTRCTKHKQHFQTSWIYEMERGDYQIEKRRMVV